MSHLKVCLRILNGNGVHAAIQNTEESDLAIFEDPYEGSPEYGCREAAKLLREAADRFDALATMKKPFHTATQSKVNR